MFEIEKNTFFRFRSKKILMRWKVGTKSNEINLEINEILGKDDTSFGRL